MSNEEKIKEIIDSQPYAFGNNNFRLMIDWGATKMAEWKDKQYSEIIKEECNASYESGFAEGERTAETRFKEYVDDARRYYKDGYAAGYEQAKMDIINELFKEEEK